MESCKGRLLESDMRERVLVVCSCESPHHNLIVEQAPWYEECPEIILYVKLNKRRFLDRLRYLFGLTDYSYEEVILNSDNSQQLCACLNTLSQASASTE